jgi:iron complex outermembrane receptor protein
MNKSLWAFSPLFLATLNPLYAQENTSNDTVDDIITVVGKQESYLNSSVSSATKGLSDPFDVPLTVNIINDVFLRDLRALTLADAYGYTTGLSQSGTNANSFTLRGLPASLQSVQVNGLPGLASRFGSPTTANVERVEVLKGPASVLYGQLEPGGLVNITTKKPQVTRALNFDLSMQTYDTDVSSAGDDNGVTATIDATGALTTDERWLYRFIASTEMIDSFRDDVDFENYYIFPTLTYLMSDTSELTFGLELLKENGKADDGLVAINNDVKQTASINTRYQEKNDQDNDQASVFFATLTSELQQDLDLTVNWRSVWHEDSRILFENNRVNDGDDINQATLRRRDRNQLNKREYHFFDANLKSEINFAGLEHNILLGVNAGFEKRDFERIRFGAVVSLNINILQPVLNEGIPEVIKSGTDRVTDLWNYGAYLQDVIHLNDQWIVMAGLRYDKQDVDFIEQNSQSLNDQQSDAVVPMAGVVFKASSTFSVYASYGESFDPNSVERSDEEEQSFDPERGEQFELGLKAFLFEDKANISVAYFDITKDNIVERNVVGDYELLGELDSNGVEVEFLAQPIDNWQIKAGYAYVDSIVSASPSDTTVGNSVAFAPENDFYLWTRYNLNQTVGGWLTGFSLGINHESIRFTSANATSRVELPSYTKVDTGIYFEQDNYAIAFNIENLFDQRYFDGGTNDTKLYPGEPRKISLTLSSRF